MDISRGKTDLDLVEFCQSFYTDIFSNGEKRPSELELYKLRLVAFVDLKEQDKVNIPLSRPVSCRYVTVLFTDRQDHRHLYPQEEAHDPLNYDA